MATKLVSMPNQTRSPLVWNIGSVSSIVTSAENIIRAVVATCTMNAAGDELGDSSNLCRSRFHECWPPAARVWSNILASSSSSSNGEGEDAAGREGATWMGASGMEDIRKS